MFFERLSQYFRFQFSALGVESDSEVEREVGLRIGGTYSIGGDDSMRLPRDFPEFSDISSDGGDATAEDTSGNMFYFTFCV